MSLAKFRELTKLDRCDRCGAQAYILAILERDEEIVSELLFCAHHGHQHMDALVEQNFHTADYSNQLQENNAEVLL